MKLQHLCTILFIATLMATSCKNSAKNNEPCQPSQEDSLRISQLAVRDYQAKKFGVDPKTNADSLVDGLKNLNFTGISLLQHATTNPEYLLMPRNFDYGINIIRWDVQNAFRLNDNQMTILVSEVSHNPDRVLQMLKSNVPVLKKVLTYSGYFDRIYMLYKNENYWLTNQNPAIARQFETFYQKYGSFARFPIEDESLTGKEKQFWVDMHKIIDSQPGFFPDGTNGFVPHSYLDWLFIKRWEDRIGKQNLTKLASAVAEIVE